MFSILIDDFYKLTDISFVNFDGKKQKEKKIQGISIDSRTIKAGEVFWGLIGDHFNGHDFLKQVNQKPTLFSVVQHKSVTEIDKSNLPLAIVPDTLTALQELAKVQRKKFSMPVIALTGSNGKTTVKEMIACILQQKMIVHKTKGNYNNHVGCPLTLLELNKSHEVAVIELGTNHPGEIETLVNIVQPNHALITNISGAHLEFFKTKEAIAREKTSLFQGMTAGSVIYKNMDDPLIRGYESGQSEIVSYSFEQRADVTGRIKEINQMGCGVLRLNDLVDIKLNVAGAHNVKNALAASAVALNLGFTEQEVKEALETYTAVEKRMQVLNRNGITIINDAYNANPVSMNAAFDTIHSMKCNGKIYFVLGDMFELGERSISLHKEVLQQALKENPHEVYIMGRDMELALHFLNAEVASKVKVYGDHERLAKSLRKKLCKGDLVLLKGSRGMEMEKVLSYL